VSTPTLADPTCLLCDGPSRAESRFTPARFRRCEQCGFIFAADEPDTDVYDDTYFAGYVGGDYLSEEAQRRRESRIRLDMLARLAPPPARLLEVGSAAGFFLHEASLRGYDPVGVEPNPAMAAYARDALGMDARAGRIGELPLPSEGFDVACAFHVVEHLERPREALRAVHEALAPGGHLLAEVPNAESAAAHRLGGRWQPLEPGYHVGQYGPESLRTLLERTGFEVLRIDTVPFALYASRSRPGLLLRGAVEAARARAALPAGPHPSAHQLLRAAARRAA
jgi:SAM-dependent methyltransferase